MKEKITMPLVGRLVRIKISLKLREVGPKAKMKEKIPYDQSGNHLVIKFMSRVVLKVVRSLK